MCIYTSVFEVIWETKNEILTFLFCVIYFYFFYQASSVYEILVEINSYLEVLEPPKHLSKILCLSL